MEPTELTEELMFLEEARRKMKQKHSTNKNLAKQKTNGKSTASYSTLDIT